MRRADNSLIGNPQGYLSHSAAAMPSGGVRGFYVFAGRFYRPNQRRTLAALRPTVRVAQFPRINRGSRLQLFPHVP